MCATVFSAGCGLKGPLYLPDQRTKTEPDATGRKRTVPIQSAPRAQDRDKEEKHQQDGTSVTAQEPEQNSESIAESPAAR